MKPKTKDVGTVLYMESKPQKLDSKVQKQRLRKHVKDENRNQGSSHNVNRQQKNQKPKIQDFKKILFLMQKTKICVLMFK